MALTYTLGILGTHPDNRKTVGYYEEIISSYWNRTPCMNVIFFASTLRHLRFVAALLPACQRMRGLRAELRQSVEYVTRHGLSVGTRLSQVLLRKRLLDVPPSSSMQTTSPRRRWPSPWRARRHWPVRSSWTPASTRSL